jgi:hypothetical protein
MVALLSVDSHAQAAKRARPVDPFTFGNPSVCAPKNPVRDFGLSRLPPVDGVPESGEQLGHGAVDIYGGWGRVMPRPESFGYGFSEHNYSGTVLLDWTVTAQLWAIDPSGANAREVNRGELFIGRLNAAHQPNLYLDPPAKRGFYRFDIQFTDNHEKLLGSYSAYFKITRPIWKPRLGLSRHRVRSAQRILSRVENLGTETVMYGEQFWVQRLESGSWTWVPSATQGAWFLWLGGAGPGASGRCSALQVPTDFTPGRYRIVKEVGPFPWPRGNRSDFLTAPFEVTE